MYLSLSCYERAGGANKNDDANNGGNQSAARAASLGRKTPPHTGEMRTAGERDCSEMDGGG
jgi:hypothetical protein